MSITSTYVTFEQAKLLKEKGYDEPCVNYYTPEFTEHGFRTHLRNSQLDIFYSAPEQWQVVEWLRVNYSIWIVCSPDEECFGCTIYTIKSGIKFIYNSENKLTPQEAYSAAFDYVLKKLI